jgi:hypothetical protein
MKLQLPLILAAAAIFGIVGGAGLRFYLDLSPAATANMTTAQSRASNEDAEQTKQTGDHSAKKEAKHPKENQETNGDEAAYFKFGRQFIAPIVVDGEPQAMMILDVMIELSADADEAVYADEPKLRDAVLRALLAQSANGALRNLFADSDRLEATRGAVLSSVQDVIGDDAIAVLLLDIGYQPF